MKLSWKLLEAELPPMGGIRKSVTLDGHTKVYYVERPGNGCTYICLHGVAGTSRTWKPFVKRLPDSARIILVDLPGFGKSHTTQTTQINTKDTDYLQFWVGTLEKFTRHLGIAEARWLGHSLGAFIAIALAHAHPRLVQSLVLVSPVGIFPTLDYCGFYYSLLFKSGFPYFLRVLRAVLYILSHLFRGREWAYFLVCYCDRKAFAHQAMQRFIHLQWQKTFWVNFKLIELLEIAQLHGIPVSLIYGEHDNLTPHHQGVLLRMLHPSIEVRKISNAGHNPITEACLEIIGAAHQKPVPMAFVERDEIQQRIERVRRYTHSKAFERYKWSSWNPFTTTRNILGLYTDLLALR